MTTKQSSNNKVAKMEVDQLCKQYKKDEMAKKELPIVKKFLLEKGIDVATLQVKIAPQAKVLTVENKAAKSFDKSDTKSDCMRKLMLAKMEINLHDINVKLTKKGFHQAYPSEVQRVRKQINQHLVSLN